MGKETEEQVEVMDFLKTLFLSLSPYFPKISFNALMINIKQCFTDEIITSFEQKKLTKDQINRVFRMTLDRKKEEVIDIELEKSKDMSMKDNEEFILKNDEQYEYAKKQIEEQEKRRFKKQVDPKRKINKANIYTNKNKRPGIKVVNNRPVY